MKQRQTRLHNLETRMLAIANTVSDSTTLADERTRMHRISQLTGEDDGGMSFQHVQYYATEHLKPMYAQVSGVNTQVSNLNTLVNAQMTKMTKIDTKISRVSDLVTRMLRSDETKLQAFVSLMTPSQPAPLGQPGSGPAAPQADEADEKEEVIGDTDQAKTSLFPPPS